MNYDKFCTVQGKANNGQISLCKLGSGNTVSPVWIIYDAWSDKVISQGKYKWVSERWRKEYTPDPS